jgi:transketolase
MTFLERLLRMSTPRTAPQVDVEKLRRLANTVRGLSIDGVEAANSGHPGLPLGCADMAVTLWMHFLRYNPSEPLWPNRDRFILSAGHGSMLLYSLLHLAGFDVSIDDLKAFRQWESKTPGHPELGVTAGVEATTGPLGQGLANSVGVALSGAMLNARFEEHAPRLVDYYTYVIASDGDLMEGVTSEACSLAGEWKLGRLIVLYDDNDITLDGPTSLSFTAEDRQKRYESYGWHVQHIDGHDAQAIADAITAAQNDPRPSLIACKTTIGFGSPNRAGSHKVHGSPLGKEETKLTKAALGLPDEKFRVTDEDRQAWAARAEENRRDYSEWKLHLAASRSTSPGPMEMWDTLHEQKLPGGIAAQLPKFDPAKKVATRVASEKALNALAPSAPWLVGGSADLSSSTKAIIAGTTKVKAGDFKGRDIYFGVREHAMGSIMNGIISQGVFRAYGGTFLTFSDYMRPAARIAALSHIPAIYVWTHDSIFLGEDGPTHQAVEHYAALRAIPNLLVVRPADAEEASHAWLLALSEKKRPTALLLTRQDLQTFDRSGKEFAHADGLHLGAYILRHEDGTADPQLILIATGSEVEPAVGAAKELEAEGIRTRVVSMPCMELFRAQDAAYRESVLPAAVESRIAIESGVSMCWHEWVGTKGAFVCLDHFGASAPAEVLAEKYGFTAHNIAARGRELVARNGGKA